MDVRRENQDEKKDEIQLLLTENLNKTQQPSSISKFPIRTEKIKIVVSAGENKSSGTYFLSTEKAEEAPKNKVWKHENNDRYIFSNDSPLGWRIGKKKQLQPGTYLFKSTRVINRKNKIDFFEILDNYSYLILMLYR